MFGTLVERYDLTPSRSNPGANAEFEVPGEDHNSQPRQRTAAIFRPHATTLFRAALLGLFFAVCAVAFAGYTYYRSPYWTKIGVSPSQPVLFSHRHHAAELKIDCRYCHPTVETSASAGMPSSHTCMTCHSQIFTHSSLLRPVVQSMEQNKPLHWTRVTSLPDHVYFNHSIHLAKGVACITCHGEVGKMALTAKSQPLDMRWCLDCHRNPEPHLQPREELFLPTRMSSGVNQARDGLAPLLSPHQNFEHLTNCSTCHH